MLKYVINSHETRPPCDLNVSCYGTNDMSEIGDYSSEGMTFISCLDCNKISKIARINLGESPRVIHN